MSTYGEQLKIAAERVVELQSPDDGGWGASQGEPSSIVNTAEALVILRAAGLPYEADLIRRSLNFLRGAIRDHPRPRPAGGRGQWTRYVTYALLGLTEYEEWIGDSAVEDAIAEGLSWLGKNNCNGGWGSRADATEVSLFHTAQAVRVLQRLEDDLGLADRARETLVQFRLGERPTWANTIHGVDPSSAKTALAALALEHGNDDQRVTAARAAEWLLENRSAWQRTLHADLDMEGARWTHMTFALGPQACLATGTPPSDERLRMSIEFLDELWDRGRRLWREGPNRRQHRAGIIPSAAVVQTYEAFSAALGRADPTQVLRVSRQAEPVSASFELILLPRHAVGISTITGGKQIVHLGPRARLLIDLLIERSDRGQRPERDRRDIERAYGGKPGVLDRMVRRINTLVGAETEVDRLIDTRAATLALMTHRWTYADDAVEPIVEEDTHSQASMRTNTQDGLTFFTFKRLEAEGHIAHGVFSRHGGVSKGSFESLNVSSAVGDHPPHVRENIRRVGAALGYTQEDLFRPRLVHGNTVLHLETRDDLATHQHREADGVITDVPGVLVVMNPADCAVVLLYDPISAAMGLIHAGWKGLVNGLVGRTIDRMAETWGSKPAELVVGIGPSVGPCHYRIVEPAQKKIPSWAPYLEDLEDGRTAIDLPGMLIDQLLEAGIESDKLEVDRRCTACNVGTFFSYWIDKPTTGRMAVALGLRA